MEIYVAFLRAVNVGGTGKLPMAELRDMCIKAGLSDVKTYIASGNVLLRSALSEDEVKTAIETPLAAYAGKHVPVMVRCARELREIALSNPYVDAPGNQAMVLFLEGAPNKEQNPKHQKTEEFTLAPREVYLHFPDGMGTSKFSIDANKIGTARNMNTVLKLCEMADAL